MPQKTIIPNILSRFCIAILVLSILVSAITTTAQTLGNYPNVTVVAGQNTTVTPGAAPTTTTSAVAYTHSRFTGVLIVNPTSSAVSVTNAKPAGTYTITVKAFGADTASRTFTLTVANPPCSQAFFGGNNEVSVGNNPRSVAVGDFNGDGKQDMAVTNTNNGTVSIRLGNGLGGFSGNTNVVVGSSPESVAVGDFNGDGKQDIVTADYFDPNSSSISIRLGAEGGTNTWLGLSTDWNSPSNWSAGMVPAACANVVVNTGVSFWPIVTGINNTCFMITVGNGANVIMAPGAKLDITGK